MSGHYKFTHSDEMPKVLEDKFIHLCATKHLKFSPAQTEYFRHSIGKQMVASLRHRRNMDTSVIQEQYMSEWLCLLLVCEFCHQSIP